MRQLTEKGGGGEEGKVYSYYAVARMNLLPKYRRQWSGEEPVFAFKVFEGTPAEAARVVGDERVARVIAGKSQGRGWQVLKFLGVVKSKKEIGIEPEETRSRRPDRPRKKGRPVRAARGAER